jgi:putative transposase
MAQVRSEYPSDLTDEQWKLIREFIPPARLGGRPRSTDIRQIICAVFYLCRTGCAWRYLPKDFPPWRTVYGYFQDWNFSGVLTRIHDCLRKDVRVRAEKDPEASLLIADSQSVRAPKGEARGFDGYKQVMGRKRQILVDTLGLIHAIHVHAANIKDQQGGAVLFERVKPRRLKALYVDQGYRGYFCDRAFSLFNFWPTLTSAKVKDPKRGILPEKKRWIVERTFAWFGHYRRLSRDYERLTRTSVAMIQVAMSQLMLRKLCGPSGK